MKVNITINGYPWEVRFVPKEELSEATDGNTDFNGRVINIRDDLDAITTLVVIRHELTHAYLCSEGRYPLKSMTQEELCEFIAWHAPLITDAAEEISKAKQEEK